MYVLTYGGNVIGCYDVHERMVDAVDSAIRLHQLVMGRGECEHLRVYRGQANQDPVLWEDVSWEDLVF